MSRRLSKIECKSGCFPLGTRVWTDTGLVPIEQIKVGDRVLSQPEAGGERAYKQVVKTFVHEDKTLRAITYQHKDGGTAYILTATDNHPLWVVGFGWTAASELVQLIHFIQLADGSHARVLENVPVYRTNTPGHGWTSFREEEGIGYVKDYVNGGVIANDVRRDTSIMLSADPYLKVRVYNFEVEDFHTYYVAGLGLWVHNVSCLHRPNPAVDPVRFALWTLRDEAAQRRSP